MVADALVPVGVCRMQTLRLLECTHLRATLSQVPTSKLEAKKRMTFLRW